MLYYVGTVTDNPNHNHEVHKGTCPNLPSTNHRIFLGDFLTSAEALREAKKYYADADGDILCCREIHRG